MGKDTTSKLFSVSLVMTNFVSNTSYTMPKRILLIGGPSTGKTTVINHLQSLEYTCFVEISREVIKKAQADGIDQLFLEKPLLFSQLLKGARIRQYEEADTFEHEFVFYDRGIPDTVAYMDYIGQDYPEEFMDACKKYRYDHVFMLAPWKKIHKTDNERYESFEQAQKIHEELLKTYKKYNYHPVEVPQDEVSARSQFILNKLSS